MIGVLVADSPTQSNDVDAGLADEAAAEQVLIDDLVRAAVGGDSAASDQLIAEVHPLVLRYCRNRLGRTNSVIGRRRGPGGLPRRRGRPPEIRDQRPIVSLVRLRIAANKVADAFRAMGRNRTDPRADVPDG